METSRRRVPWFPTAAGAALLALLVLLTAALLRPPAPLPELRPLPIANQPDIPEDPAGRRAWELNRLVDPSTGRLPPNIHRREQAFARALPQRPSNLARAAVAKSAGWKERGPYNVGGRTRAVAVDLADPSFQTLLAGAVTGGLWRSENGGASWDLTTGSSQLHSVTCLQQDVRPGHQHVWYYGTGEGRGSGGGADRAEDAAFLGDGVYRSTDGGRTWSVLPATLSGTPHVNDSPFDVTWRLAQDPTEIAVAELYLATAGGVFRSVDDGASWDLVLGDPLQPSFYADVAVASDGVVYATLSSEGGQSGAYRSPDGLTWTRIRAAFTNPAFGRIALSVAPSFPQLVYFLVSDAATSANIELWRYFYVSGDGSGAGGSWTDHSAAIVQLPNPWGDPGVVGLNSQRGYNLLARVSPASITRLFISGVHLWRSESAFANASSSTRVGGYYYPYPARTHHGDVHDLVFQPGSTQIAYTASDGGVHRTEDINASNVTWTSLNHGYDTTQFYTVALDHTQDGSLIVLGGTQDNGTLWTDQDTGTEDWAEIFGGDGAHCVALDPAAGEYVASYYRANMYRILVNADGVLVNYTNVAPEGVSGYLFINPFLADAADERVLYLATDHGVWRQSDVSAIPMGNGSPTPLGWSQLTGTPTDEAVTALAVNALPGHSLYYGTAAGGLYRVPAAMTSGFTVPQALHLQPGLPAGAYVSGLAVHPDDDQTVLACFANYGVPSLWLTHDGGMTWTDVEGALAGADGPSVRCVEIVPAGDADLMLCGTSTGLYSRVMDDPASDWTLEADQAIGNVIVEAMDVRLGDRTLAVGTHGRGIFTSTLGTTTGVAPRARTTMAQNAPNPFNPSTEIAFTTAADGPVRLEVCDVRGRRVRVLADEVRGAGAHAVTWDGKDDGGRNQPSGVYLARLRAGDDVREVRMTLVR